MTIDLQIASEKNLSFLLNALAERLDVANRIMFDEKFYRLDQYDDLKFLYDHIMNIETLSPSEVQAFIDELRTIRDA